MEKYIILEKDNFLNSDGVCNLSLTKSFTNLENIKIETNLKSRVDSLPKGFNFKLYYKGHLMKKVKILGEGTFGKVILYQADNNFLAIKINHEGVPINDEIDSFNKLLPKVCKYSIIPLKIVKDQRANPFLIMQMADGDLKDLKLSKILKIKVLVTVSKALNCFLKKGIIYMDLKLENILYKCVDSKITIYLGDVGSLAEIGTLFENGEIVAPESKKSGEFVANEAYLLYTFGIFILEIFGYRIENLEKFLKDEDVDDYLKALVFYYTTANPKKRVLYNLDLVNELIKKKFR